MTDEIGLTFLKTEIPDIPFIHSSTTWGTGVEQCGSEIVEYFEMAVVEGGENHVRMPGGDHYCC